MTSAIHRLKLKMAYCKCEYAVMKKQLKLLKVK